MKLKKAIKVYFAHNPKGQLYLKRILTYNPKLSYSQQATLWKCGISNAHSLITKFDLPSLAGESRIKRAELLRKSWETRNLHRIKKWNPNLTIRQNCLRIGISYYTGMHWVRRYGLKYCHHSQIKPAKVRRIKRIMTLSKKGLNDAEIGRFFGYSREYVRQIKHEAKFL
jgi:hypothetical protein